MSIKDQLIIIPLHDYPAEIGRAMWQLEDTRQRTLRHLERLSPAALDWHPPHPSLNSIGTLLYHIAGVEMDWLYTEVLQAEPTAEVEALFPHNMRDKTGKLSVVTGVTLEDHLMRLQTVRQWVRETFKTLSLEDFRRARSLPNYDVTPEWVLYHLMQHESEHLGEMMVITDLAGA